MNLAEAIVKVVGDFAGFRRQIETEGDRAGQTLGQRMRPGLTRALGAGIAIGGAALAGAAAVGTKGVIELDNAMADYQATTGATAEQTAIAAETTEALFRGNLGVDSYAEAAAAQAALRTNLGLTEDQIDDVAGSFVDYARITGQDVTGAIEGVDDILDAWNMDASESGSIMDQLIASNQKYGGSVEGNADVLGRLAPQLRAANMGLDDGVGLLNLFAASGIDASKAPQALTQALSKVESPEQLQQMITDIAATEDEFERARLATDLFGSRAGPQLAAALDEGTFSLGDYAIGAEAAAGTTETAADALDDSFGRKAELWIRNIQGMATDLVQGLGPGIGGLATTAAVAAPALGTLGSKLGGLATQIGPKLLGGLLGLGPVVAGAGTAVGTAFSAAASAVIAAWPLILIGLVVAAIVALVMNPELRAKALEVGGAIVRFIGEALGALVGILGNVLSTIGGWVGWVVGVLGSIPGRVAAWVGQLIGQAVNAGAGVVSTIAGAVGNVVSFVLGIPGRVAGWIGGLIGGAASAAAGFVGRIAGMVGDVIGTILGLPGRVIGGLADGFASMGRAAVDAFLGFIRGIPEAVGNIIGGIGDFVGGLIPSFDVGTDYVPRDMLAKVHSGEMIVPARDAAAIRSARGNMPGPAAAPGGVGGGLTVQVYNPVPEPASTSVRRELQKRMVLGTV